ncbi:MAG: ribbon-helix-helix domain-containing protein [Nitratireductor sp.]
MKKRSVSIRGHRTSYSIEDAFQEELNAIALREAKPVARMIARIDAARQQDQNLSSAIRLFVLDDLRKRAREI